MNTLTPGLIILFAWIKRLWRFFTSNASLSETKLKHQEPKIHTINVSAHTKGWYLTESGLPRGVVIHYTAGRFATPAAAENTLRYMASKKLGALVMDQGGRLYAAKNQYHNTATNHAGRSKWKEFVDISKYCVGIEVCCAGRLTHNNQAWFGDPIPGEERNVIPEQYHNQKPGTYHAFTALQEAALINFCLWQLATNPDFDVEWIVGHDEIAPTRKSDPGGSLSVSMPDFREMVRELHRGNG